MPVAQEPRLRERLSSADSIRRPRFSLHAKILSLVLVSALLPALLISAASYFTAREILVQKSHAELTVRRDSVLGILENWRTDRLTEAAYFAQAEIVAEGLSGGDRSVEGRSGDRISAYLEMVQEREPLYASFAVYDRDGELVKGLQGSGAPESITTNGPQVRIVGERDSARIAIQQPVIDSESRELGKLLAVRRTDDLWDEIEEGFDVSWGRLRISNADGETLFAIPEPENASSVSETGLCLDEGAAEGPRSYPDSSGTLWIGAYSLDDQSLFCVGLEVEKADILHAVYDLRRRTLAISVLGAALVTLLGFLLVRGLLRPIQALIDGAEAVAQGELNHEVTTRSGDEIGYLTNVFNLMIRSLRHSYAELEKLSITDALTGLSNRRDLDRLFSEELARARRNESPIAVLMIDIDHFKVVNDRHGHAYGDRVLRELASLLRRELRITDVVARYGGEEFTVLLPGADQEEAVFKAEAIREACAGNAFCGRSGDSMTLSIGVAVFPTDGQSEEELLGVADRALYQAKNAGRDRVICAAITRAMGRESSL